MLMMLLALGCRSADLHFALVAPSDLGVEQAYARLTRYRLRDCDGGEAREWVGRRINLQRPSPDTIRDREWCGIDLEFKEAPLLGPPLGWRGETAAQTPYDIALSPERVSLDQSFGGWREDLVLLLDLDLLLSAGELDLASKDGEAVTHTESSDWSQSQEAALASALTVLPLRDARQRDDWVDITLATAADEPTGCAVRTDTAVWWGDSGYTTDTGAIDSGWSWDDTTDTGPASPSSGGCDCSGGGTDTGPDTEDTEDTEDTGEPEDDDSDSNSGSGCSGGVDTGRAGLVLLLGALGLTRRRSVDGGPEHDPRRL